MKILENNGTFKSADGKTTISYIELKNENSDSYKGSIVFIHGIGEHKRRHMYMMQQMVEGGYVVFAYDCIGHGESVATGQAKMYFSKWDYVVKDFQTMCHLAKEKYLNIPCFAFGFSMGSFIVRTAITKEYSEESKMLAGAIFAGTGGLSPFVAKTMAWIVNKLALSAGGEDKESEIVNHLAFDTYLDKIKDNNKNKASWLYVTKGAQEDYLNDELAYKFITPGMFRELLLGMAITNNSKNINNSKKIPILIISGDEDPVGEFGKGVIKVEKMYGKTFKDVTIRLFINGRHAFLDEDDTATNCVCDWLDEKRLIL